MRAQLNYRAANLKPIERPKENTCLKVFFKEKVNTLRFYPGMQEENVDRSIIFITKFINVKSTSEGMLLNDSLAYLGCTC